MKFRYEDLSETILCGDSDEELDLHIEEDGEWTQDGKYQSKTTIFRHKDSFYSIEETRSGSPFSHWEYEEQDVDKEGYIECEEVFQVEIIKKEWHTFPVKTKVDELEEKLSEAEDLLQDAKDLLNNIHGYDTDTYRNISKYFNGEEE